MLKPLTQGFEIGDEVTHKKYGYGVVTDIVGNLITISFSGRKVMRFALNQLSDNKLIEKQ